MDSLALPLSAQLTGLDLGLEVVGQCLFRLQVLLSEAQLFRCTRQPADGQTTIAKNE